MRAKPHDTVLILSLTEQQNMSPNISSCHITKLTVTHTEHQGITKGDKVWPGQHLPGTARRADLTCISHS